MGRVRRNSVCDDDLEIISGDDFDDFPVDIPEQAFYRRLDIGRIDVPKGIRHIGRCKFLNNVA